MRTVQIQLCLLLGAAGIWLVLLTNAVAQTATPTSIPIDHFIYIIQENHSFDSYFGTYPYDLASPLKLIETRFGLSPLTKRDASSNNMLDCFDFSQKPLPPDVITPDTKLDFSNMVTTQA